MAVLDPEYLIRIFLVFVRIGALFASAPVFSQKGIPNRVKILLAVIMAYGMVGISTHPLPPYVLTTFGLVLAVTIEVLTGVLLGFTAQFIFWAVQFAGEMIGFQLSLTMAQVIDPMNAAHSNPAGQFISFSFLLVFLSLDGHHMVLQGLANSFLVIPPAGANVAAGGPLLLRWTGGFIASAFRLSAPFMVTIFLIDAALGVIARVVPQADLFSISLPLKLLVGTAVLVLFIQQFIPVIPVFIDQMTGQMTDMMNAIAP